MRSKLLTTTAVLTFALAGSAAAQEEAAGVTAEPLADAEIVSLADWGYDELYAEGWSAGRLMDAEVHGPMGEEIGDVENVIVGPDGRILSVIAEVGGFWDIGDTHVNIPWDDVEIGADLEQIVVPVTEENVGEYSLFNQQVLTAPTAAEEVTTVDDDLATGPRAWRATELIGDYAMLEGDVGYGYVDDLVFSRDGELRAVVVRPDVGYGGAGAYAYPYYGYGYGWGPGMDRYGLPYGEEEIGEMEPFDYGTMDRGLAEAE